MDGLKLIWEICATVLRKLNRHEQTRDFIRVENRWIGHNIHVGRSSASVDEGTFNPAQIGQVLFYNQTVCGP